MSAITENMCDPVLSAVTVRAYGWSGVVASHKVVRVNASSAWVGMWRDFVS